MTNYTSTPALTLETERFDTSPDAGFTVTTAEAPHLSFARFHERTQGLPHSALSVHGVTSVRVDDDDPEVTRVVVETAHGELVQVTLFHTTNTTKEQS